MKPRTRSAFAPTYVVETRTIAISLRGYCRTVRARIDCSPAIRITRFTTIASTGRLTNKSVNRISTVLGLRSRFVGGLNLVIDENGGAVSKFKDSRGDDLFLRFDTRKNCDLIPARGPDLYKLLARAEVLLPLRIFEVFDDEYRIAIWGIADRGSRKRHGLSASAQHYFRLNEHSRPQLALWVGQRCLHLNVSSGLVDA